jgi:hypothetical protein
MATGAMAKRVLYIINHRTLVPAEAPILRDLGYELFSPKVIPGSETDFTSGMVTYDYDAGLTIPAEALRVLNAHDFYRRAWSPTVTEIINTHFDVAICTVSVYMTPLIEAVSKFSGLVIARTYGRERPWTYTDYFTRQAEELLKVARPWRSTEYLQEIEDFLPKARALGERFVFGQAYDNLGEVEAPELRDRECTITLPLPRHVYEHRDSWHGDGTKALFVCPQIRDEGHYRKSYTDIKETFGDLPHQILGRQTLALDDPAILGFISDAELFETYASTPVLVYTSTEPRHVHYSPIEAMVVGTPVLYRQGGLIDSLAGGRTIPGACKDMSEMKQKTKRLLDGDLEFANEIRASERELAQKFDISVAAGQWKSVLEKRDG